jgi:chromosomal replication initiation ATPase DnaA
MKSQIFNEYVSKIAHSFEMDEQDIFVKSKKREVVDARHLLYYVCSKRPMQVVYIQKYMNARGYIIGHPNILYGIKQAKKKVKKDKDYADILKSITT